MDTPYNAFTTKVNDKTYIVDLYDGEKRESCLVLQYNEKSDSWAALEVKKVWQVDRIENAEYPTRQDAVNALRHDSSFVADQPRAQNPSKFDEWDEEVQEDLKEGKLYPLLEKARKEHRNNK